MKKILLFSALVLCMSVARAEAITRPADTCGGECLAWELQCEEYCFQTNVEHSHYHQEATCTCDGPNWYDLCWCCEPADCYDVCVGGYAPTYPCCPSGTFNDATGSFNWLLH